MLGDPLGGQVAFRESFGFPFLLPEYQIITLIIYKYTFQ